MGIGFSLPCQKHDKHNQRIMHTIMQNEMDKTCFSQSLIMQFKSFDKCRMTLIYFNGSMFHWWPETIALFITQQMLTFMRRI